jgi:antitoxin CptB
LTVRQANALNFLMDLSDNDLLDVHLGRQTLAQVNPAMDTPDVHAVVKMLREN